MLATIWLDKFGKIPYGTYPCEDSISLNLVNELAKKLKKETGNQDIWVERKSF